VIISGRRKGHLDETTKANPGMQSVELDVADPASIAAVTKSLIADYPKLNVLINNAGIMLPDDAAGIVDEDVLVSTVTTNLLGPIRLTSALIEHLKKQDAAAVLGAGIRAAGDDGGVFIHESGTALLYAFPAVQAKRHLRGRARDRASVGLRFVSFRLRRNSSDMSAGYSPPSQWSGSRDAKPRPEAREGARCL
jgi:NAD(P)-dependent dehydrogenase (short-subunit alcohol dehydrogenase family)